MKRQILSLISLIGFLILSCSSNDDDNKDQENSIIGEWKLISISINGQNQTLNSCMLEQTRTFQTNGNLIEYF